MNVFMPVDFNAPAGGLHEHVRALARMLAAGGHRCTIMCKPGPFAEAFKESETARVLATDFIDFDADVRRAVEDGPYDLVHAHPFKARKVGIAVAEHLRSPGIVAMHGMYLDGIDEWSGLPLVVCVSTAIRDHLLVGRPHLAARCVVVPNGVDTHMFYPSRGMADDRVRGDGARAILFVSRFHVDKRFIVDCLLDLLDDLSTAAPSGSVTELRVVGEGPLEDDIRAAADSLALTNPEFRVRFLGWRNHYELAREYQDASVVIAPGRSAMEAMACGRPVIAVGSRSYIGLVDASNIMEALHTNFGGVGCGQAGYSSGQTLRDVLAATEPQTSSSLGRLYRSVVPGFLSQDMVDEQMRKVYTLALELGPLAPALSSHQMQSNSGHSVLERLVRKAKSVTRHSCGRPPHPAEE
jgi:glycosyltransferase involved in cell wall biosynthesis